jgi:hypothetical protein
LLSCMIAMILTVAPGQDHGPKNDARVLIETIESVQQPVEDFRCEFEGTTRFMGKIAELPKDGDNGPHESFSGVFIWKRGGDIHSDSLKRRAVDGRVDQETLVVRAAQRQAEEYYRPNDAAIGHAVIKDPKLVKLSQHDCYASIFLLDTIKRDVTAENHEAWVSDDEIDGRPLKVLNIALRRTNVPNSLIGRYWIDLRRNGHVVRAEGYQSGQRMGGRLDIRLAPFRVGGVEVWMPVHGVRTGYVALVDKKVVVTKDPTSVTTLYVVNGTMEFNKGPGPQVFTIKYKPGTPISDKLRKLQYEFGQQSLQPRPTKADVEGMLNDAIAKADAQKAMLVVAPQGGGLDWMSLMAWGFGAMLAVSSIALLIQRWRR